MILMILGIISINVLLQTAEPLIHLKRYLGFKEEEYDSYTKQWRFIHRLIYCCACLGFWVALLITFDIFTAAICSVASELVHKKIME